MAVPGHRPLLSLSRRSNPRWVAGELQGQLRRNEIAIRTQHDIARLYREIVEHRRRTNALIDDAQRWYHRDAKGPDSPSTAPWPPR